MSLNQNLKVRFSMAVGSFTCRKRRWQSFSAWETEVRNLLERVDDVSLWAINTVTALSTFVNGRVALLCDAAHAMTPQQGSGAGQAIEDGYILSALLGHASVKRETVHVALQVYDAIRRPFAHDVQRRSRISGMLYQLDGPGCEDLTVEDSASGAVPLTKLNDIASALHAELDWMAIGSAKEEYDRALQDRIASQSRSMITGMYKL